MVARISSVLFPLVVAAALLQQSHAKKTGAELERSILREFFDATNGHGWNDNTGWDNDLPDVCGWAGVECLYSEAEMADGDKENTIIGLYLGDNFLSGRTPPSLWKLPNLRTLDISYNPSCDVDFGSLDKDNAPPLEIVNARQTATTSAKGVSALSETIERLILSDCKFESQFPPDLLELRKLQTLAVSGCSLRGSIPNGEEGGISKLEQLRIFDVYGNDLTGTIPEGLATLVHLRDLILSKNQFHGKIPSFVNDELVMLEKFWVNMNDLTGEIPAFENQPSIQQLYLNGNEFTGTIPETFLEAAITGPEGSGTTGNQIEINLGKNEFDGQLPASLDRLETLPISWRFGGNTWTGVAPELCDNVNWNGGSIAQFGCQGLICPPNFYSAEGYYTAEDPCEPCLTSEYFGTFECFDQDDRAVLMDLYKKLGGENWIHNDGWKDAPRFVADDDYTGEWMDYCNWYGVECWQIGDAKDYRLRKLQLGNNNLVGTMPENIFSIEHMTTLDVSNNPSLTVSFRHIGMSEHIYSVNVGGTATKDYDGIQHATDFFKRLYADNTPIAGTLPSEIPRIHSLEVLSLQECQMNGEIPHEIFAMSTLQELYLTDNNFQGPIPDRWGSLVDLESVSLAKNMLRGAIPESFGFSPKLKALSLKDQVSKGGGLSGTVPSFHKSQSLTHLFLADNKLEGDLPKNLLAAAEGYARDEDLSTLFHVDFTNNKITGAIHFSFERFRNLDLYLEGNLISEIDERLCNLPNTNWMAGAVSAYGCDAILCPPGTYNHGGRRKYTDDECVPCKFSKKNQNDLLGIETYLGQSRCEADDSQGIIPLTPEEIEAGVAATPAVAQANERAVLKELFEATGGALGKWKASDGWSDSEDFCTWYGIDCDENDSVISIQLGSNGMKGDLPTSIWSLPNLTHLKIYGNQLKIDFEGVEAARNLKTLGLDDTGLDNLDGISKARSLTTLNVAYNDLAGALPEELSRLVNLEYLDVSHNKFSGELPSWLKNFVALTSFTASHNAFEGQMPDFATMYDMSYVDLSNNKFGGDLPPTLFSGSRPLRKIVVNVSFNQIGGVIPGTLAWMQNLSLQIQGNKITDIDQRLCFNQGWNDFGVRSFGCDGILCPVGTWNSLGRQTSEDVPCEKCRGAKFMGSTTCGSDTTTVSAGVSTSSAMALLVGLLSATFMLL